MKRQEYLAFVVAMCFLIAFSGSQCEETGQLAGLHKPGNLLLNPDFVVKTKGGTPFGWSAPKMSYDTNMSFCEGMSIIKVEFPEAVCTRLSSYPFEIEQGKIYTFSIWLKAERPTDIEISFDGGTADLAKKLGKDYRHWFKCGRINITDEWKKYSITAKIPGLNDGSYCADMKRVFVHIQVSHKKIAVWATGASVTKAKEEGEGQ